jgi:alpha-tubulin suppressor-like RCC1 family protein
MITSTTSGVWELDEVYAKRNAERWRPGIASYELYVWGYNAAGQLGNNVAANRSSPVQIPGTQWTQINAAYASSKAIKSDGTLWSWGYNSFGNLGHNDLSNKSSPIQVPGTQWDTIATGEGNNCTLVTKTDGTLWISGYNYMGRLGLNDNVNRSSPIQIPGTQWVKPNVTGYSTFCLKTDGTLWTWGWGAGGNLGLNDTITRSSPTQLPGTQWNAVHGGILTFNISTKTDGTLWTWGINTGGQLGVDDTTQYSSPVQVPGTQWSTDKKAISVNANTSFAIKNDGTLWAWGENTWGNLGQNNRTNHSSPRQIPGTQWSEIESGYAQHIAGLKTDGTLWTWGRNTWGNLGQNNLVNYSSPVQIPGTGWYNVSSGSYHKIALKQIFTY